MTHQVSAQLIFYTVKSLEMCVLHSFLHHMITRRINYKDNFFSEVYILD